MQQKEVRREAESTEPDIPVVKERQICFPLSAPNKGIDVSVFSSGKK